MTVGDMPDNDLDTTRITWHKTHNYLGETLYLADRPDGTTMSVTEHTDGSITVFVVAPDGESEFLMGELEERTVNDGIEMAEEVVLPDDDTGA